MNMQYISKKLFLKKKNRYSGKNTKFQLKNFTEL